MAVKRAVSALPERLLLRATRVDSESLEAVSHGGRKPDPSALLSCFPFPCIDGCPG
jgi:hypothetical protein